MSHSHFLHCCQQIAYHAVPRASCCYKIPVNTARSNVPTAVSLWQCDIKTFIFRKTRGSAIRTRNKIVYFWTIEHVCVNESLALDSRTLVRNFDSHAIVFSNTTTKQLVYTGIESNLQTSLPSPSRSIVTCCILWLLAHKFWTEIAYRSSRNAGRDPHKQVFVHNLNPIELRIQFAIAKFIVLTHLHTLFCWSIISYWSGRGRRTTSLPCVTTTELRNIDRQTKRTGTRLLFATPPNPQKGAKIMVLPSPLWRIHCKPRINICMFVCGP